MPEFVEFTHQSPNGAQSEKGELMLKQVLQSLIKEDALSTQPRSELQKERELEAFLKTPRGVEILRTEAENFGIKLPAHDYRLTSEQEYGVIKEALFAAAKSGSIGGFMATGVAARWASDEDYATKQSQAHISPAQLQHLATDEGLKNLQEHAKRDGVQENSAARYTNNEEHVRAILIEYARHGYPAEYINTIVDSMSASQQTLPSLGFDPSKMAEDIFKNLSNENSQSQSLSR